jgi:signal peptidase
MIASSSVYIAPHFGWRFYNLRWGSMSPQLNAGDLLVTRSVEPADIVVGDIIIFNAAWTTESPICHRVIGIQRSPSLSFQTRGDANEIPDPFLTPAGNLVGRLSFHIPLLGPGVPFVKTVPGLLLVVVVPGLIIIMVCLKTLRHELVKK